MNQICKKTLRANFFLPKAQIPAKLILRLTVISALLATIVLAPTALATTRTVPTDFLTIQEALDASTTGDTVLVLQGFYSGSGNVELDFHGKSMTLRGDTAGFGAIIGCNRTARAFVMQSGENSATVIENLDIQDGFATGIDFAGDTLFVGGAVLCVFNSSPTFRNCVFENCTADNGGAVFCAFNSNPRFEHCEFLGNAAIDPTDLSTEIGYGGALLSFDSGPTFVDCDFSLNSATYDGGAIYCDSLADVTVENSVFDGNQVGDGGAGIACFHGSATVTGCDFLNNETYATPGAGSAVVP